MNLLHTGDYSDISSVPSLPPPLSLLNDSDVSPEKMTPSHSLESLSIEVELQLLLDKVTTLEANYERIVRSQDEILSRLAALENRSTRQQMDTSFPSFDETDGLFFNQPPMYIPPPPLHPPRRLSSDEHWGAENQTPSREYRVQRRTRIHPHPPQLHSTQPNPLLPPLRDPHQLHSSQPIHPPSHPPQLHSPEPVLSPQQDQPQYGATQNQTQSRGESHSLFSPPPHPPKRFILASESGAQPRVPFHPITNQGTTTATKGIAAIREKPGNSYLPSSAINKQKLKSASAVILRYPKLRSPSNVGTLAAKLAREAYFGADVLAKCTVAGDRDLPGLPISELQQLKQTLFAQFPDYWRSPHEFEPLWSASTTSIGQLCKRLRGNSSNIMTNL